jgi:WD40 repeat protein
MSFCRNSTRVFQSLRGSDASWLSVWDLGVDVMKPLLVTDVDLLRGARTLACSPDGTRLPLSTLGGITGPVDVAVFSPDGNTLAVGADQAAYLWNTRDSTTAGVRVFPHAPARPGLLAFSSDGSWFAVASTVENTGHTAVWDLRQPGSPAQQLPSTRVMAFSHDGGRLATSNGSTVRIWDLRNPGTPTVNFQWRGRPVVALAFSSDNLTLKVGDLDGRVAQWRLWSSAADFLCTRVWRNLSMSEWQAHVGEGIPYERTCPNLPPGAGAPGGPK